MESNFFIDLIKYSFIYSFICIIFYDTNVIVEYFKHIRYLNKLFKINDYLKYKEMVDDGQLYIAYIGSVYNNFFIKLISCPLCLGFWVNILISIYVNKLYLFFGIYYLSVIMYSIFKRLYYAIND